MARNRDQERRRGQLVAAAERAVLKHGAGAVRLRDVADEAGLTSGAVLYYYGELDDLLVETHSRAVERFCQQREETVDGIADPREQLRVAIRAGLPIGPEDELVKLLYEFDGQGIRRKGYGRLSREYFARQVSIYHSILVAGQAAGHFTLTAPARDIGRNLVALEDGYGYYVVLPESGIDRAAAEALIVGYAEVATGCRLREPEA
jgi:DNA-binding transcriptional regulator YbjK